MARRAAHRRDGGRFVRLQCFGCVSSSPSDRSSEYTTDRRKRHYSLWFVTSLVQLRTGELSDRTSRLSTLLRKLGTANFGLFALQFASSVLRIDAAVLLFVFGAHKYRSVRSAYLVAILPKEAASWRWAVRTILTSAGALGPVVTGLIIGTGGYRFAFPVHRLALALGIVLIVALRTIEGDEGERTKG